MSSFRTSSRFAVALAILGLTAASAGAQTVTPPTVALSPDAATASTSGSSAPAASTDSLHFYLGLSGAIQHRAIGQDVNLGTAAQWGTGFGVSQLFGYRWDGGYRLEFEIGLLDNPNIKFWFPPYPNGPVEDSNGHVTLRTYMINGYYDFKFGSKKIKPFVGGGWGITESRINGVTSKTLQSGIPGIFGPTVLDTASRYTKSGQIRAGVDLKCKNDRFSVFFNYLYFQTAQLNFKTETFPDVQVRGAKINGFQGGLHIYLF